jgi:hypothetical protein
LIKYAVAFSASGNKLLRYYNGILVGLVTLWSPKSGKNQDAAEKPFKTAAQACTPSGTLLTLSA